MAEQWRDLAAFSAYQVFDLGQVRNTQTSKILQPVRIKMGGSASAFPTTASLANSLSIAWWPQRS